MKTRLKSYRQIGAGSVFYSSVSYKFAELLQPNQQHHIFLSVRIRNDIYFQSCMK